MTMKSDMVAMPPETPVAGTAGLVTLSTVATNYLLDQPEVGRTARIIKMQMYNRGTGPGYVLIGDTDTGAAVGVFTQRLPGIPLTVGEDRILREEEIARYEFNATNNIFGQVSATVMEVEIIIETMEIGP